MSSARNALALLLGGLAVDLIDVRIAAFDLLPDVVGLALVVLALRDLSELLPGLARARRAALAAAVLSLADVVHPLRTSTESSGAMTTSVTTAVTPTGLWGLAAGLHEVAVAVLLVLLCGAVARAAREGGWTTAAGIFRRLVLWNTALLAAVVLMTAAVVGLGDEGAEVGPLLWPVVVLGVALRVWTMARLWGLREGPPLVHASEVEGRLLPAP